MALLRGLLFWTFAVTLSTCSPFSRFSSHNHLVARQNASCQNPQAGLDSSCWDALGISNYLNGSATGWVHNTPTCKTGQDSSTCCQSGEAWANCFIRLAAAVQGQDCTQLSSQDCRYTGQFDPNLSPSIKAQAQYVALTIWRINALFNNMYGALVSLGPVVQNNELNLAAKGLGVTNLDDAMGPSPDALALAISLGVIFLGDLSPGEIPVNSNSSSNAAAKSFVQSLRQAPAVAKAMWPNGKGDITGLSEGLKYVMTDVGAFIALANHGIYSGSKPVGATILGLGGGVAAFADAANTYSTSYLLQANNWYAVPGPVGPAPLTGCTGFGDQGEAFAGKLCTASDGSKTVSYWSPISSRPYTFLHKSGNGPNPADLLQSIATNSWANMPALFDGAYQCTFEGKAGPDIAFDDDGMPDTNCLSVLPIYLQCGTSCPQGATQVNKKCPFGFERKC